MKAKESQLVDYLFYLTNNLGKTIAQAEEKGRTSIFISMGTLSPENFQSTSRNPNYHKIRAGILDTYSSLDSALKSDWGQFFLEIDFNTRQVRGYFNRNKHNFLPSTQKA